MRIAQLLTQSDGGPADHAVDVACELARRGHESHLVGPSDGLSARLTHPGVRLHDITMGSKWDLPGAGAIIATLKRIRPDVLHCQDRRAGLIGRVVGRATGVPALVYTLHGVADGLSDLVAGNARAARRRRRDGWYYLTGERLLCRATRARVVVPSRAVARFAVTHIGLDARIVDVVPNGVDAVRFSPRARPDKPSPAALWLGVMAPVKRLDTLLDALTEVPELELVLVGSGPEHDAVEKTACERGVAGRVAFRGPVVDPEAAFAEADLFVLTSAAENCPLALLQAMACGLPVVASRVGGVPEIVRDGVDGLLFPAGHVAALARALRWLIADPARARSMGVCARKRVIRHYTLGACVDGLLDTYRKALSCT
jgi:glycosyltransferase involved in cell wall biosynthesis